MTTQINLNTKMQIGYKFEVALTNGTKIMAEKNRQICITLENDLYNIYAFTLKGIDLVKEVNIKGIFADDLQNAIIEASK